jgi:protein subunit release factor B
MKKGCGFQSTTSISSRRRAHLARRLSLLSYGGEVGYEYEKEKEEDRERRRQRKKKKKEEEERRKYYYYYTHTYTHTHSFDSLACVHTT